MRTDGGALYTQIEQQLPSFIQHNHSKFSKFVEKYYEFLELNLVTFNDLDLNEDKPIQESDNVTYTVTVATGNNAYSNNANKYYINGEVSPTLSVNTGITYIFDQSNSTNLTHILYISTTPNGRHTPGGEKYSNGVNMVAFGTPGSAGAQTSIYISPDLAGNTLYYYCNNHSGMGGSLSIANTTPYISLENGNTDSSNTNNTYIDLENPNRQGDQFLSGETVEGANSGATGIVRGKFSTTQAYIEETNQGNFQVGERIVGQESRVSANVTSYTRQALNASRNVKSFQDVDKAPLGFVELFRKEFLQGVPKGALGSKANMLKHIKDFYRAKGNEASFQFIFRLLYGKENVSFYYPSTDILRLSDGRWTENKSLKIDYDQANNFASFEGRLVRGSISNVVALVERTETYQVGSATISELYLSNIDANNASYNANTDSGFTSFLSSDTITTTTADDDGNFASAPLTGILASVTIDAGGSNYSVGDDITVSGGGGGREAAVKVASVSDATISAFDIIDPGDGFAVGDGVTFTNEGTGGTGGAARVQTITPTANVFVDTLTINPHKEDLLSASAFTAPLDSATANTHLFSNSTTTFSAGVTGTAPKKGDFLFELSISQLLAEDGDTLTTETGGGVRRFDIESIANDTNYDANTAKFGTVVSVDTTTTPNTIIYAVGSVIIDSVTGTRTVRNFENTETVFVYDTQRDGTGSPASANGHNAVLSDTGANVVFANTPAPVTSNTSHGALAGTLNEVEIGGIRSIQVLSSGQGYTSIPVVEIANTKIESFGNAPDKVGANSVFVTLASAIANQFSSNTIVKNQSNSATGLVLGPITSNTSLVATGNTVLRVQMTTSNNFSGSDTLTAYTNNADENPVGIGDFGTANVSTSGATATFTQADHGFTAGQRIVVTGSSSGTDATVYNNNHTIATVSNTSTFTVTFPSTPSDTSESNLRTRRIVSANVAASNSVFANTGAAGNNASITISSIAIGAIQSVTIINFGANYTSAPTLNASGVGGGDATLTATLGALAEYDGFFDGAQGLLSGQNRMQDNFYYQDFSYVIKTDIDTATYRDQILNLVHPSGLKMFGEVVMYLNATAGLMNSAANTINDTQANTSLTGGSVSVPNYRLHELTIAAQNTASSNVQISIQTSLFRPALTTPEIDAKVEFPSISFDLILEQSNAGVAIEGAQDTIGYETASGGGSILLDDGFSKIRSEEFEVSIIQEDESNLELEAGVDDSRNYLLSEPTEESTQIVSEDDHDVFNIRLEEDGSDYLIEQEGTELEYILFEDEDRMMGIDYSKDTLLMTLEAETVVQDEDRFIVIDRTHSDGFIMPQIQFPESETGAVQIDMGYGTQLKLEDDNYLLLERTEGMFPLYLAMEDSMQDEVIVGTQIQINPIAHPDPPVQPFIVSTVDESDSATPYEEQVWIAETGGELVELEDDDGGHLLLESNFHLKMEGDENAVNRFIFDFATTTKASVVLENLEVNLPYGTGRSSSFEYKAQGNLNVTMGEEFELLAEDGRKFVEESVPGDLANLTTEGGDIYLLEHSYLSNQKLAINRASDTTAEMRNFIAASYDRKPSITGTGTNFDSDFNAPIVLEDDDQTLVAEGPDGNFRLIRERSDDGIQPFGTEHSDNTTTYINLETYTDDGDLILIEGDDRTFMPIELEDDLGNLALEVSESNPNRRLIYNDYLDVIIEEEFVALEEDDRILMEDYVSGDPEAYLDEAGNNLVLEHLNDNLATEGVTGIFHITYDLKIEDFTASVALEDNTSIVLESHTPTGIGDILLTANGDRLIREDDVGDDKFFLSETSYARTYANATITVVDDNRKTSNQTRNFITNGGDNLISEDGDSFVSEVGEDVPVTSEIEIIGDVFPHGSHEFARVVFADGDTAEIVSRTNDYLYNVDYGAILLEDDPITHATEYLLSEEGSGSKIIRNYHQSSAQNYRLEYARHNQASSINQTDRFMKTEIGTTDTNNSGREYQFSINGITTDGTTLPNLHEWSEIHGDNVVMEDGANILTEDGEVGQDPNAILLEFENVLMSENTIIEEAILDEDGGNIVLEDESDDSEYLTYEENEHLELESFGYNYKLLNMEGGKYRIDSIANNTFMKLDQETDLFTNAPFRVNHLEQVPS